jgi:hypothetical protein
MLKETSKTMGVHFAVVAALTLAVSLLFTIVKRRANIWNSLLHWTGVAQFATSSKKASAKMIAANKLAAKIKPSAANNHNSNSNSNNHNNCNSPKSKQVHFAEVISVSSGDEHSSTASNNNYNHKQKHNESSATVVQSSQNTQKVTSNRKTNNGKHGNGKSGDSTSVNDIKPVEINNNANQSQPLGSEPSADELDSSVLLEVFNPTKAGMNAAMKRKQTTTQRQPKNNAGPRKRHSSDGNHPTYSSEQLFKMIAASSLSSDEVEMAVETLLNKLESGETDWQKPKSDPLHRLKNQLRDSETALSTEIQNHEQTRARIAELKAQLQNERSTRNSTGEELTKIKKDLITINSALERAHNELSKQRMLHEKACDESSKIISKLEEDNVRLQNLLAGSNVYHDELSKLRHEFNENVEQLQRYETANESLRKRIHELESNLRAADVHLGRMREEKQQDDYEACAKISKLESDRGALEKALKDNIIRLNEVLETKKLLEKSLNEAQISCAHKEEVIKRLNEEKHNNETSMKRALFEMEQELRMLHERLSSKMATDDERFRQELNQFERELTDAGQREQKLKLKMKQLREGLSELFPDLMNNSNNNSEQTNSDDWVHHYLNALKQLTATVDELRRSKGNEQRQSKECADDDEQSSLNSPSKRSVKSSLLYTNGKSSRVGSPTSNGRSSRGE